MKKTIRTIAALAVFLLLPFMTFTARAEPEDDLTEPEVVDIITEELPVLPDDTIPDDITIPTDDIPVTDFDVPPPQPFTPAGTATVTDYATDKDGKEFYTIITTDEHVFYLVVDRQRGNENVYFLNAVTAADLMALAIMPENDVPAPLIPGQSIITPETVPEPEETAKPPAVLEENSMHNMGAIIFVAVALVIGGIAGWYFKIHKPKQQKIIMEEDYTANDPDQYEYGSEQDDEVPWYDGDEAPYSSEDNEK